MTSAVGPAGLASDGRPGAEGDGWPGTTPPDGLTAEEVAARVARGEVNAVEERTSRTLSEIVRANVFTRFNAILGTMFVLILATGAGQDALFGFVLIVNSLIGIAQEWRAKRTLDRLAVLSAPRARVIRDGRPQEVAVGELVVDDLTELRTGDQVPADGLVCASDGLEVDESMLTGESDPVPKRTADEVLSGSIVVAGRARFQATRVGADAYARRLSQEARRFTLVSSDLVGGINRLLRYIQWALVPAAAILAISQFQDHRGWRLAMAGSVAGVVAMIPQGLVLLTSIAFAVAALTLARRQVLVQELPAVEGLARVDVVLLDKTGTITEGAIRFQGLEKLAPDDPVEEALGALAADENRNATMNALSEAFPPPAGWGRTATVPFSSARKWSGATFAEQGTWVLGAPELLGAAEPLPEHVRKRVEHLAGDGRRVVLLAHHDETLESETLPEGLRPSALAIFEERIRADAPETLRFFSDQGVALKVISGDNPRTVAAVARQVGLPDADRARDARDLPDDPEELAQILEETTVFGRVTPQQKRAIVGALQQRGHVVAMTGDGVNDALALKDADLGIAMGNAAPATRSVAQLVLLDNRFASMPGVVGEGRRVTANVERVANLFVTKTVYATLLAVAIGVARWPYPFLPRHLTIVDALTIGIPGFFLALAPNRRRYQPGFMTRVLRFTLPAGLVAATATFVVYALARHRGGVTVDQARTAGTLALVALGLWVLNLLARPITPPRAWLFVAMVAAFAGILAVPGLRHFFALEIPSGRVVAETVAVALAAIIVLEIGWRVRERRRRGTELAEVAA
jgi:cation-transporting ATPase E